MTPTETINGLAHNLDARGYHAEAKELRRLANVRDVTIAILEPAASRQSQNTGDAADIAQRALAVLKGI